MRLILSDAEIEVSVQGELIGDVVWTSVCSIHERHIVGVFFAQKFQELLGGLLHICTFPDII